MKTLLTIMTLMLTLSVESQARSRSSSSGSGNSYAYAEANSYDLEHSIMQAAIARIKSCAKNLEKTCNLTISKDSKFKIKDYISLMHDLSVKETKDGLSIDLTKELACADKIKKVMLTLTYRSIDENKKTMTKKTLYSNENSWAVLCTLKDEVGHLDFYSVLQKDADIVHEGAPMAFSEEYIQEIKQTKETIESLFSNVQFKTRYQPVTYRREYSGLFNQRFLKWVTEDVVIPTNIYYGKPKSN